MKYWIKSLVLGLNFKNKSLLKHATGTLVKSTLLITIINSHISQSNCTNKGITVKDPRILLNHGTSPYKV